mmetsp:Transcript_39999/g.78728  ORF Transcript_39999/g.78728 Transcript_39999/m.78728 type:complete len:374 (-) Transcript_39999:275-1396(-)
MDGGDREERKQAAEAFSGGERSRRGRQGDGGAGGGAGGGGYEATPGFKNLFRSREGAGLRFVDLLEQASSLEQVVAGSGVRLRFTSPHPKDFPLPLLQLINERPHLCNQLHLPAQSGSDRMLSRMRRGYTNEAYRDLVDRARSEFNYSDFTSAAPTEELLLATPGEGGVLRRGPPLGISSDFIVGFCGETEEEHAQTLELVKAVGFDMAYLYAYSLRERTHAAHQFEDDVEPLVKKRRLQELIHTWRSEVTARNLATEVGTVHLVLVEGPAKKRLPASLASGLWTPVSGVAYSGNEEGPTMEATISALTGRTDTNKRVVFSDLPEASAAAASSSAAACGLRAGDYVEVEVVEATGHTLRGRALKRSSIPEWSQ